MNVLQSIFPQNVIAMRKDHFPLIVILQDNANVKTVSMVRSATTVPLDLWGINVNLVILDTLTILVAKVCSNECNELRIKVYFYRMWL